MPDQPRWHAVVTYLAEAGPVEVEHDFEEVGDFEEAIERGPSFGCIEQIVITYTGAARRGTIEQAATE